MPFCLLPIISRCVNLGSEVDEVKKRQPVLIVFLLMMLCSNAFADEIGVVSAAETENDDSGEYSTDYTYEELTSALDTCLDHKVQVTDKIIEVGGSCPAMNQNAPKRWFRLCMDNDNHNILFVSFEEDLIDYRLYDDDRMIVYGIVEGSYDYESPSGAVRTLPWIRADRIERTGTHEPIVRKGQMAFFQSHTWQKCSGL